MRPSLSRRIVLAVVLLALAGCSAGTSGTLTITSPGEGAVVTTRSIDISGTAPAGAEVVQDISFSPDQRTTADSSGRWTVTVDLDEGANELTFRIGSDKSTARTIHVTYTTPGALTSPSERAQTALPTATAAGGKRTPQRSPRSRAS